MALKTFNVDEEIYKEFSKHCKENGISMSKKVEKFIQEEMQFIKENAGKIMKRAERKMEKNRGFVDDDEHPLSKYC